MSTDAIYWDESFSGRPAGAVASRPEHTLFGVLLLLLACGPAAVAQPSKGFTTADEADTFATMYYQQPRPEMIEHLIDSVPLATLFAQKPSSRPSYVGFFSEVFAANPDSLPRWQEDALKQGQAMKAVVGDALAVMKAGGVMARKTHSAADNDMDWGGFFASGRAEFVEKLVGELRLIDSTDMQLYWAGATAKWSLGSNAQSHPRVREILEAAKSTSDKRTQEIVVDLLQKDPARIREEVKDTAAKRWGSGQQR